MKDRKLHASGGIAGQLHMNRPGYATGEEVYGPSLPEEKIKSPTGEYKTREEIIAEAGLDSGPSLLDYVKPIPQYDEHGNLIPIFSKTGKQQIDHAPEGMTSDKEFINFVMSLDIPIDEKISLLGDLAYGKARDKIEYKGDEIDLDEGGGKSRKVGIGYNEEGDGFSGHIKYDIDSEEPEAYLQWSKKFNKGGIANHFRKK